MNDIKHLINYTRTFFIFTIASAVLLISAASAFANDEEEFIKAAFAGKPETIKQLLEKGINAVSYTHLTLPTSDLV